MSSLRDLMRNHADNYVLATKNKEASALKMLGHVKSSEFKSVPGFECTVRMNSSNIVTNIPPGLSFTGKIDGTSFAISREPKSEEFQFNFPKEIVLEIIKEKHPQAIRAFEIMFDSVKIASVERIRSNQFEDLFSIGADKYEQEKIVYESSVSQQQNSMRMIRDGRRKAIDDFNQSHKAKEVGIEVKSDFSMIYKDHNISNPNGGKPDFSITSDEMTSIFGMSLVDYGSIRTFVRSMMPEEYDGISDILESVSKTDVINDSLEQIAMNEITDIHSNDFRL